MKKILSIITVLFLIFLAKDGHCATYYLSASGDNSASSTDCSTGPMDMTDFNGASFGAGDTINVCDDDGVFRSQMTIPSSGTEGNPITIQAMTGDDPIISGADLMTDWDTIGSDIWYSVTAVTPNIVILNNRYSQTKTLLKQKPMSQS